MKRTDRPNMDRGGMPPQNVPPASPRRNLSPAEKKARDKAIRQRVKEKRKQAKQEEKLKKKREKALRKKHRMIARQRQKQRSRQAMNTPGGLPDGQTPHRVTRSEARRRRRRRAIITVCLMLLFIGTGFLLSVTVLFQISDYRVDGECIYSQEELVEAFGHEPGENMFRFKISEAEEEMTKELPYLESIKVRRSLPETVVFIVTPAQEKYSIETSAGILVLSGSLRILRTAQAAEEGLCVITGLQPESNKVGDWVSSGDATTDELVKTVLDAVDASEFGPITAIDFTDPYDIILTYDGRIKVKLGTTAQLEYKLEMVKKTLEDSYFTDTTTGTLDASDAGKTTFRTS